MCPRSSLCPHVGKTGFINGFKMGTEFTEMLTELMTENQIEEANRLRIDCVIKKYKEC